MQAYDHKPEVHRESQKWLARGGESGTGAYVQSLTTDAGFSFTFEGWNL